MADKSFPVPEPMEFDRPQTWPQWVKRFGRYMEVTGKDTDTDTKKISNLVFFMGSRAEKILLTFDLSEADSIKYTKVVEAFENYFLVKRNLIFESAVFNSRCQLPTETADQFITDLFSMVQTLDYGDLKDRMLRDRIVVGIRDKNLVSYN